MIFVHKRMGCKNGEELCKWYVPHLLAYQLRNILKMVKSVRFAGRVARMRSSKSLYAVKHGESVVAVEHVLDVFSPSVTMAFKYVRFSNNIGICTLTCWRLRKTCHTFIACHLSSGTAFVVSRAIAKQSSRKCQQKFPYTCDHKVVFLLHVCLLASYTVPTISEMLSYRVLKLCSRLVLRKTWL
jgi:hypothetical protein